MNHIYIPIFHQHNHNLSLIYFYLSCLELCFQSPNQISKSSKDYEPSYYHLHEPLPDFIPSTLGNIFFELRYDNKGTFVELLQKIYSNEKDMPQGWNANTIEGLNLM